jgi:AcrR family transcriptional regulator
MTTPRTKLGGRKTPVQQRSLLTRTRILDAAARVFSDWGYSAGTTNRIAAEAQLSIGSLYQYFPNKDAILVELVRRHVEDGTRAVLTALSKIDHDDPRARRRAMVAALVDAMIANHVDDPELHQVLFEEAPRPPALLAELHELETQAIGLAHAVLASDPTVTVADPALAARIVVTTIEAVVHRVVATRDRQIDRTAFRDELVRMVDGYLVAG